MVGWEPTAGHLVRSATNILGITGGLIGLVVAERLRRRTAGAAFESSVAWFEVGTMVFVLDFLLQELRHGLGINLIAGTTGPPAQQFHAFFMMSMAGLSLVTVFYAISFKRLVDGLLQRERGVAGSTIVLAGVGGIGFVLLVGVATQVLGMTTETRPASIVPPDDLLHYIVPHVGQFFALVVAYYAYRASQEFEGAVVGRASRFVMFGGLLYFASYVPMELRHVWGINLLAFLPSQQFVLGVYFFLFTPTVLFIALGYHRIGRVYASPG